MTNYELINKLATSNSSNDSEDFAFQELLKNVGFDKCIITCGIVYLEGTGEPFSINTVARIIINKVMEG